MRPIKPMKSIEKKRRLAQFKNGVAGDWRGFPTHIQANPYDRSSSAGRNKKKKIFNEYEQFDKRVSQEKTSKKKITFKRKRDQQQTHNKKSTPDSGAMTPKSHSRKSNDLKQLLKKSSKNSDQQRSKEKRNGNLKKNSDKKERNKKAANYFSQIQPFESLCSKIRKSTSKAKKQSKKDFGQKEFLKIESSKFNSQVEKSSLEKITKKNRHRNLQSQDLSPNLTHNYDARIQSSQSSDEVEAENDQNQQWSGLTEEEEQIFGERFPYGFQKVKLLGKGGFSLVWLGKHVKSEKQFAIKQIITENVHQTHLKEIWFSTTFFMLGGIPKPEFPKNSGVENLVRIYSYEINKEDTWIFYEKCGTSLGGALYDIRAERNYIQNKLYRIHYKPFYHNLIKNPHLISKIIIQICKPLSLISSCKIVHSDLKTENILIKVDSATNEIMEVKLIDYGSSFEFDDISQFSMATPEYMPPEILNYIIHENEGEYQDHLYREVINNYHNPWVIDIFSLGCVLLELIIGVPLWMSLPVLIPYPNGKSGSAKKEGLFAVKGRIFRDIIHKQRKTITQLDEILEKQNFSGISVSPELKKALKGMLNLDFNKRISPAEVIKILQNE